MAKCKRIGCEFEGFGLDSKYLGCCSYACRDVHVLESELASLRAERDALRERVAELEELATAYFDIIGNCQDHIDKLQEIVEAAEKAAFVLNHMSAYTLSKNSADVDIFAIRDKLNIALSALKKDGENGS